MKALQGGAHISCSWTAGHCGLTLSLDWEKVQAASPMFAYCGLAWLPGNPFPKTGKEIRTKQKAGNDGRKSEKTSMRNECTCVNRNISVFRTMKTPYKLTIIQRWDETHHRQNQFSYDTERLCELLSCAVHQILTCIQNLNFLAQGARVTPLFPLITFNRPVSACRVQSLWSGPNSAQNTETS